MTKPDFVLGSTDGATLQDQIRRRIVDAAISGAFPIGCAVPSSRSLAQQLGVSRNTVVQAYQRLLADGFLVSHPRSGLFVDEGVVRSADPGSCVAARPSRSEGRGPDWASRIRSGPPGRSSVRPMPNWMEYPYPFIDGLFDPSLFPVAEWRETDRLALSLAHTRDWSIEAGDADDEPFVDEIRSKLLMRRGIHARADEVLVTTGAQHARYLVARLLMDRSTQVALEEPGLPEMLDLTRSQGAPIVHQGVDDNGMIVDERLDGCRLIYLTPSQQAPTGVTLSIARRHAILALAAANDSIIIEDDTACEMIAGEPVLPTLHALDRDSRVIYLGSLPRVLSPGLQLGFIVGPAEFIAEARRLRRLSVKHPPRMNQRAAALFMSLGHYDATLLRLRRALRERRTALLDALDYYLPRWVTIERAHGGTSYWVRGACDLDAAELAQEAERHGVLIEPVDAYYGQAAAPMNVIRMSITGLPAARIRPGVAILANLIQKMAEPAAGPEWSVDRRLSGRKLRSALAGAKVVYKTVYGEPSTLEFHRDGTMTGRLGFASEEVDEGTWSVEGDIWRRRWRNWAYGEDGAFHIVIADGRLGWFTTSGRFLDSAILIRP